MMDAAIAIALLEMAKKAMENAYAPYSGYKVGAALLTSEDEIYTGCNIENSSYTPTVCAERVAVFKAVSGGKRNFNAIAIVGGKDGQITGLFPPCGVCRQVLAEFCDPASFEVILGEGEDKYKVYKLGELLPLSFGGDYMNT